MFGVRNAWPVIACALVVAAGCSADVGSPTSPTVQTSGAEDTNVSAPAGRFTPDQRRRADEMISVFEHGTTDIAYGYAENVGDGRGVTSGSAGFTTATCDAVEVVENYSRETPDNPLSRFVPELKRLCAQHSDATDGLPQAAYIAAWKQAANDPRFRAEQDKVVDREYYVPAMELSEDEGVKLPLTRAEIYDAAIQHGVGEDPDGMPALVQRTTASVGKPDKAGEMVWLNAFLDIRSADLRNPANSASAAEWRRTIDRVECIRRIARTGNTGLDKPITFFAFGSKYTIP
jgi:chitosanase